MASSHSLTLIHHSGFCAAHANLFYAELTRRRLPRQPSASALFASPHSVGTSKSDAAGAKSTPDQSLRTHRASAEVRVGDRTGKMLLRWFI